MYATGSRWGEVAEPHYSSQGKGGFNGGMYGPSGTDRNFMVPAPGSRYTPMDFQLLLDSGRDPTDEMRRSPEYYYWYQNNGGRDVRRPPPLPSLEVQESLMQMETPWTEDPSGAIPGSSMPQQSPQPQQMTPLRANNVNTGTMNRKPQVQLDMNPQSLKDSNEPRSMNPYGVNLLDENALNPNTQFLQAYAPSPIAGASPNTFRAYTHGQLSLKPEQSENRSGNGARCVATQQYYTQEPMGQYMFTPEGYYGVDPAMAMGQNGEIAYQGNGGMNRGDDGYQNRGSGAPHRGGGGKRGRGHRNSWRANRTEVISHPRQNASERLQQFRLDVLSQNHFSWQLGHIVGYAVEFAQDQEGSRFIQSAVDMAAPDEIDVLFREIFESPLELVTDIFGNYVLQKLLDKGTPPQLIFAAHRLKGHVVELTLQTYGCRVIQKCIEVMPDEGQNLILEELEGNVARCIQDQNGNHVVQKCVEIIPDKCEFIILAFSGRVMELATHAYGCRVIQCIMEHCKKQEETIFAELLEGVKHLVKDQYGNYVIQHVLQHSSDYSKVERIYAALKDNFYEYSKHKYASNVMEKLYACSDPNQRMALVDMICAPFPEDVPPVEVCEFTRSDCTTAAMANTSKTEPGWGGKECKEVHRMQNDSSIGVIEEVKSIGPEHPSMLCQMMNDQFANYVVQRILDASEVEQFVKLVNNIQTFVLPIRTYCYGRPIVQRLTRRNLLKTPGVEKPEKGEKAEKSEKHDRKEKNQWNGN